MAYSFSDEKELILFSDESVTKGKFYSNFYGGALVGASQYQRINHKLEQARQKVGIQSELKWSKVSAQWLDCYKEIMDAFFEEITNEKVRVRIMCRQNAHSPVRLTDEQRENQYFLLYYQFIKNAFGLDRLSSRKSRNLRLFFDQFPDKLSKVDEFKTHIKSLEVRKFRGANLSIREDDIVEARSHDHIILQCLDVVLGAMSFRMNDMHLEKPEGAFHRGKRTIAKEKLYKHIRSHICEIKPHFNIGISTGGTDRYPDSRDLPYAHWIFKSKNSRYEPTFTKSHRKKN